jgi:ABC-type tungstate transport system permease subunit
MTDFKRTAWTGLLALALAAWAASATAQAQRSLVIASPSPAVADLVNKLAPLFLADSGIQVSVVVAPATEAGAKAGVVIAPDRLLRVKEAIPVFRSEIVIIGLRGDRARVRGLREIDKALRWISTGRSTFMQSSEELGVRALELAAWERIGVDVLARPRWYEMSRGGDDNVAGLAADLGAYTMMEEASWAGLRNRRGLEVLVSGDPSMRTTWVSAPAAPSKEASAWQSWIASDAVKEAITSFRYGGVSVFGVVEPPKAAGTVTD